MPEPKLRALVVDDESQMLSIVAFALETQGFQTVTARSSEQAWRLLTDAAFDLAVLDVTLPGASGVQLCQRIRATSDLPVILLTARGDEDDRVRGLLAGADDYITKPFSPRELALRAAAVVRRAQGHSVTAEVMTNGPLSIDRSRRVARLDDQILRLSDVELRLLITLTRHVGQVVDLRTLLNEVWDTAHSVGGRDMIKTAIYRLRQQLGPHADALIVTIRGVGYSMPKIEATDDEHPDAWR